LKTICTCKIGEKKKQRKGNRESERENFYCPAGTNARSARAKTVRVARTLENGERTQRCDTLRMSEILRIGKKRSGTDAQYNLVILSGRPKGGVGDDCRDHGDAGRHDRWRQAQCLLKARKNKSSPAKSKQ